MSVLIYQGQVQSKTPVYKLNLAYIFRTSSSMIFDTERQILAGKRVGL